MVPRCDRCNAPCTEADTGLAYDPIASPCCGRGLCAACIRRGCCTPGTASAVVRTVRGALLDAARTVALPALLAGAPVVALTDADVDDFAAQYEREHGVSRRYAVQSWVAAARAGVSL